MHHVLCYYLLFKYSDLRGQRSSLDLWPSFEKVLKNLLKRKMSKGFEVVPLKEEKFDSAIEFLRENFFPEEPCAQAIDLCPLGYR